MPSRRISALAENNPKTRENSLWLHPTWHFASRVQFFFYFGSKNCVTDKLDYLFREWAVTGITVLTIGVGITNPLAGNMVCIKRP